MSFNSSAFLFLFVPVVLILQFLVGRTWLRNVFLLVASLIFYSWGEGPFVLLLVASIGVNYAFATSITQALPMRRRTSKKPGDTPSPDLTGNARRGREGLRAKLILGSGVAFNLALLVGFKYIDFIMAPVVTLPAIPVPLGISFFTFSAISYLVDIYRREAIFDGDLMTTGLYLSFFPKLLSGPIIKYRDMVSQIHDRDLTVEKLASGAQRFVIGLAKKVLIADILGGVANQIFAIPTAQLTTSLSWLGILCYTLQLFLDFSGYVDMAIGLGRMSGFDFPENFNYPYVSRSIREFWTRWHITLSQWLRDYLYIPLGGNRGGTFRVYLNLLIVFALCGLWHGAAWTFVVWGVWHGIFVVLEHTRFGRLTAKIWPPLAWFYATLIVMIGWVLFRSATLGYALGFLGTMFGFAHGTGLAYFPAMYLSRLLIVVLIVAVILSFPLVPIADKYGRRVIGWSRAKGETMERSFVAGYTLARIVCLGALLVLSAMAIVGESYYPFLYSRF
jgi:alginate O-acetyltransferase complex protein AlgI